LDEGGIGILARDITQGKRQQGALEAALLDAEAGRKRLAESEEQLRLATEAGEIGLWDVDPVSDALFWPARVKAMFGISADAPVSMERDFYPGLHPDDREQVTASFGLALDPVRRALYDVEYRTIGKEDGVLRWVAAKGRGIFDENGTCVRVIGTAIDITRRKEAEDALKQADQRKDEFIATLSHELRNPLAPIANAVLVLKRAPVLDERCRKMLDVVDRQLRHLVRLVDDLLDVSRVSRGMVELRMERVRVNEVLDIAREQILPLIAQCKHEFSVTCTDDTIEVMGDRTRLTQVIGNLLTNAARYTPEGGRVRLHASSLGSSVLIAVEDNGQGFDAGAAPALFEMFTRSRDSVGLGIGLALARNLVRMHGGTLAARSDGPGKGATFTVEIPLCSPQGASS
jgi:PAS domain S-box-containing protein